MEKTSGSTTHSEKEVKPMEAAQGGSLKLTFCAWMGSDKENTNSGAAGGEAKINQFVGLGPVCLGA